MPKTIDFRTYLTLETALIRRLVKDWRQRTDPVYDAITKACRAREWDKARVLVRDLDLYETAAENREWIKYMLLAFAIFGAGQVSKEKPSFVGVGTYDKMLNQVVANMIVYLEHAATKQVQEEVLQLIAEDEAKHKAEKREHEYGIVMIVVKEGSAVPILEDARKKIADTHLMGDGKDVGGNHVTVRYGLLNDDVDRLRDFLRRQTPFEVTVEKLELFEPSEHSEGACPVVARVESEQLRKIHDEIDKYADFKAKSFPEYKPHITIAYVKPEAAEKYKRLNVAGSFMVTGMTIGHRSGVKEFVPFGMVKKADSAGRFLTEFVSFGMTRKSNPYHDETGAFTSKELATNVIPGEFKGKWTLSSEQQAGMAADPKAQIRVIRVYEADSKEGEEPSETRVREYRSAMDRGVSFPLPEVYQIGEHSYKILDGNHRFAAWQKSNKLIPVIVHPRDEGEYVTGHVDVLAKKADPTGRFLTEFVSFGKEGDEKLQLIASLNASRLATWGFTAECELRGVQEYQLTAVLDGRTSEFCRMIHGKRFRVEAARKKIIEVLNVQNPDDLRTVQPWPKQTKANLEELRELSVEELTARGFHVPPFHPGCRTVCRLVDEDVQLEKAPVENPTMTQQWITLDTLKELGIKATPEQIAHWNAYVALSPIEILQKLSGKSPQEILSGVLGKNAIQFQSNGDIAMQVRGVMADAKYAVGTVIDPYTATYYLTEAELLAGSVEAEREFLRRLFNSLIEIGQNSSVETLVVAVAGNGAGYVKMGFLPDAAQWNTIRAEALDAMENGELKEMFASLSNEQKVLVQHLLQDMDEHALGALVDLPVEFQGKTIGDWVLESVYGNFELKLTDKLAVEQAKEFLK